MVHHAPQNPCLSFIKVKITFVIRMWTIMVKMKQLTINTISVAGLPCPTEPCLSMRKLTIVLRIWAVVQMMGITINTRMIINVDNNRNQ